MRVNNLRLKNFRNQKDLFIEFPEDIVLISGNNGSGKTSVLEAIQIISTTKSFKAKRESEIIKYDESVSFIALNKEETEERKLSIGFEKLTDTRLKKSFSIDDIPKRANSFIGDLLTVLFTTDLVNEFNDKAIIRRRFFNQFLSQLDKEYLNNLTNYLKVVKNKSKILHMIKEGGDPYLLRYWNDQQIAFGTEIILSRQNFIKKVSSFLDKQENVLKYKINLEYITKYSGGDKEYIRQLLRQEVSKYEKIEIESGRCLVGPHKDDYEVDLNDKDIKSFGSRGEQKFSLSLLLYSIAKYINEDKSTSPIILLDDLGAEMDKNNLTTLLDLFLDTGFQVIVTSVYPDYYDRHISYKIKLPLKNKERE